MKQYLDLLQDILDNGQVRKDRTGTGTISVFGRQLRFENVGERFPLVTTKKMFTRGLLEELLWLISGSTNINVLKNRKVSIWNEWADECGDLGKVYGYQWRRKIDISYDECEIAKKTPYIDTYVEPKNEMLQPNDSVEDDIVGKTLQNNEGLSFIVLDKVSQKGHNYYKIQFLGTGSTKFTRRDAVIRGSAKDDFHPSVYGVGYLGHTEEYEKKTDLYRRTNKLWGSIMQRCYDKKCKAYPHYGGRGVRVSRRWHNFANFFHDLSKIYGYYEWKKGEGYHIDKDMFGGDVYSLETCIFVPTRINEMMKGHKPIEYHGKVYMSLRHLVNSIEDFKYSRALLHLEGKCRSKKYQDIHLLELKEDEYVRFKIRAIDQLQNVISTIKTDPFSRRLIVSAWDAKDIPEMALPPCHTMYQFYVREKEGNRFIDLHLYQRSGDCFLGIPFNIASYAALLMMVAQVTGLKAGDFVHTIGDAHIYLNHVEQAKEQLKREPFELPRLVINPEVKTIDDFRISDFSLDGYQCHPAIKGEVSV